MERTQQPVAELGWRHEDAQTTSLTALGFKGNLFPFPLPRVIGPFNYLDARATFSQSLFNYKDLEKERAAAESLKSASR